MQSTCKPKRRASRSAPQHAAKLNTRRHNPPPRPDRSPGGPAEHMEYRMPTAARFGGASRTTARNERMSAPGADNTVPAGTLMRGKRGLIMGVANNRSIAWGIAKATAAQGAALAFTYQGDALKKRVEPLAAEAGSIDRVFAELGRRWDNLDFLVHAIAFSDKAELDGRYVDTSEKNFTQTMLISCYSFTALAQRAEKLMRKGGSLLTLTYYGAEKVMPHYNVMGVAKAALEASVRYLAADLGKGGIRVNAISAGPIKTLAAAGGIADF